MGKKIKYIACLLLLVMLSGCNFRDLDRLGDIADDHEERLRMLEEVIIECEQQIGLINKLLHEYDSRVQISRTVELPGGGYAVVFSDGDSLVVNDGRTPLIEVSEGNTWVINGTDTGIKVIGEDGSDVVAPLVRAEGGVWEISGDGGITWTPTGVIITGGSGADAVAPAVSVGANGNWFVGGTDTGVKAVGEDGISRTDAPQIEMRENPDGSKNWWIKNGTEEWKDTGIMAAGLDGQPGQPGSVAPYITQVLAVGDSVTFVFSADIPGRVPPTDRITVVREAPFVLDFEQDGRWLEVPRSYPVPVDEAITIRFRVTMKAGNSLVNFVCQAFSEDFGAEFMAYSQTSGIGTLQVRAFSSVREYCRISVAAEVTDNLGRKMVRHLTVEPQVWRLEVKDMDYTGSGVFNVYDPASRKIAEICREYIDDGTPEGRRETVIYPYDYEKLARGIGHVTSLGGTMDPLTAAYLAGGAFPAGRTCIYMLNGQVILPDLPAGATPLDIPAGRILPYRMRDASGNSYSVVKVGTQYWMAENLHADRYRDGIRIPEVRENADWAAADYGAFCIYDNQPLQQGFGYLYNLPAVLSGRLAPTGWHVATDEEWKVMEQFLGMSETESDMTDYRGTVELVRKICSVTEGGTDVTGFGAIPAGTRLLDGKFMPSAFLAGWWSPAVHISYARDIIFPVSASSVGIWREGMDKWATGMLATGYSVRCVRDFIPGR